jgi:hypothetical protein
MGANLGVNGKLKWERCIECPFHGWIFDGETVKIIVDVIIRGILFYLNLMIKELELFMNIII